MTRSNGDVRRAHSRLNRSVYGQALLLFQEEFTSLSILTFLLFLCCPRVVIGDTLLLRPLPRRTPLVIFRPVAGTGAMEIADIARCKSGVQSGTENPVGDRR